MIAFFSAWRRIDPDQGAAPRIADIVTGSKQQEVPMTKPTFTATLERSNLVVIESAGSMDPVSMEVALDLLVPVVKDMSHGGMLVRAQGVEWPSLGAIGVELRHWGQLMAMIRKVDRVAVLTDDGWMRNLAAVESFFIPNLEVRSFAPDQEDAARVWLEEGAAAPS
ncbi:STAS/SEC14 domain-containing protein [Rhodobacteraceae bacterium W635]|nr:STAS/SEC14 domain-containing protein [Rhodobacteraceae bacterium W635]